MYWSASIENRLPLTLPTFFLPCPRSLLIFFPRSFFLFCDFIFIYFVSRLGFTSSVIHNYSPPAPLHVLTGVNLLYICTCSYQLPCDFGVLFSYNRTIAFRSALSQRPTDVSLRPNTNCTPQVRSFAAPPSKASY